MYWIKETEYIACLVIAILMAYSYKKNSIVIQHTRLFHTCLTVALIGIILNIISVYFIEMAYLIPTMLNNLVNTLYFIFLVLIELIVVCYIIKQIYEKSPHKHGFNQALLVMIALYAVYFVIVITNLHTGLMFYFDENFNYIRGPLNRLTYLFYFYYVAIAFIIYFRERKYVEATFLRTMIIITILSFAIIQFEHLFPNIMFSGSAVMAALLILFINCQNQKINTDHITGLATHNAFYNTIDYYIEKNKNFTIVMILLHSFKSINNTYGHRFGDALLKTISNYIQNLDQDLLVSRFNNMEFTVILVNKSQDFCQKFLLQIMERFREPWQVSGIECEISASFADISYPRHADNANDLITSLRYALSLSKRKGAGALVSFDEPIGHQMQRRKYVIDLIKNSLQDKKFFLCYQPVYDFKKGKFLTAEALIRLHDDYGNVIFPAEFIPLAEEAGLIVDISWYALKEVCSFFSRYPDLPLESISVNFSAQQFMQPGVEEKILEIIESYNIPPCKIKLEITERVIAHDTPTFLSVMEKLSEYGICFHLDDFGTGYSNLSYVITLPFECIKMDKSLVHNFENDTNCRFFIESLTKSFKFMGAQVLVEGVETEKQAHMARSIGIDKIQGYYYSMPLKEQELYEFLLTENLVEPQENYY